MKKFKFKLQKVQDTKETQVKQKSGELSKLSYQKATKVQELEDLHGELSMIQREIYEKTMGGCPVHEVLDSHKYADKITQQIKQTRKQIEQLDEKIISTFNVPLSAVKGKSSSSYASELVVTSYFMLSANSIVDIINEYMEQKYPNTDFSDAKVVLEVWKTEIYKRAILASKSGVIDANEIRKMMNLETKPSNTINVQSNVDGRTVDGIVRSTERTDNNTPHRSDSRNKLLKDRSIEEI